MALTGDAAAEAAAAAAALPSGRGRSAVSDAAGRSARAVFLDLNPAARRRPLYARERYERFGFSPSAFGGGADAGSGATLSSSHIALASGARDGGGAEEEEALGVVSRRVAAPGMGTREALRAGENAPPPRSKSRRRASPPPPEPPPPPRLGPPKLAVGAIARARGARRASGRARL